VATLASSLLLAWCSVSSARAAVDRFDQQFVDGLRQRRLFSLAESFCLERLDTPQQNATDTVHWSIELIRIHAGQAVNTVGAARDTAWEKAADIARQFEIGNPDHPRLPLVQVQAALALLAQGELFRMEAEIGATPDEALALARTTIRAAANKLEAIDEHLTQAIPLASRNARQPGALTAAELSSLQQNVRYQWARALRNQALCYPAGSTDRVAALTQTAKKLELPLQILPAADPLVARIKIDQSICLRLLGELQTAATMLNGLDTVDQPAAIRLLARAESIRLLVTARKLDEAVKTLDKGRAINGTDSPELDFAYLEVYVAKWRLAGSSTGADDAVEWEKRSIATLEFIEQTHGPYWGRRAELLLVGANQRAGSGNVNILVRAARDLYLKGRLDDAVVAYDRAVGVAAADGDTKQSFALAYKAALIEQQRKRHSEARRRFRELAQSQATNPLASNAHLLAIVNLAQEARADSSLLSNYGAWLNEHLRMWPSSESADTARLWLGQLHEARQEWELAVGNFSAITFSSDHSLVAVSSSRRCWSAWLEVLGADGQPVEEVAQSAIQYLDTVIRRNESKLPDQWGPLDGECLVSLARIHLRYLRSNTDQVEQLLRVAIENAQEVAVWRNAARSLLVLAVLRKANGQREAQRLLQEIGDTSTDQLLELLAGIEHAAADAPQLAASIGTLERDIADRLLRADQQLEPGQLLRVSLIRAAALVKLGDADAALEAYAALARHHTNQAMVQVAYAEQLLLSNDREPLRLALSQWRRIAAKTRPRTARWFRAKYSIALTHFKLGDKMAAAKLIRYLQATEDLAVSGLDAEFRDLLKRSQ
jgi:tetratricopeptide (TPR) repeat protein